MKVLILGGDGYLGWPTAMNLTARGHQVLLADNYLRRRICRKEDAGPLFEVPELPERIRLWRHLSGHEVKYRIGDLADHRFMERLLRDFEAEAVVHYAEQPSAPYSMLSREAAELTLINNLQVTFNLIQAVKDHRPQAHIVKLGTMGEYGTPNIDIEEGWLDIEHKGRQDRFLFPRQASSLYHTTKIMDTDLLWFYVRMWDLKVTDLMQGPVYGLITDENQGHEQLYPFFNYDELFGTVVNRFVVQAAAGYPLTVYGAGGQTRGYLDIRDTLGCVRLSLENPPSAGELRIFNQFVETFSVNELAERVRSAGASLGLEVQVNSVPNPRLEAEEHYYNPTHSGLLDLGLEPHYLDEETLAGMLETSLRHRENIDESRFFRQIKWK